MTGMHRATIHVSYVNPPKGRGPGSVKDGDGNYWKVWGELLAQFEPDTDYVVAYTKDIYEGKEQRTIKAIDNSNSVLPSTAPQKAAGGYSKDELIFVCGAINNALHGSGTIPEADTVAQWVRDLRRGLKEGFTDDINTRAELDDKIPF